MTDSTQQLYGPDGDPCTSCGAPMAGDQRYCLNCGTRRPEAVLPFLDGFSGGEAQLVPYGQPLPGSPVAAVAPVPLTLNDRLRDSSPLIGLLGVLGLALLIGVLLGHWAGNDANANAATPPPQVISIGGGAAAPAAAPAATSTTPTDTSTDSSSGASSSGSSGKSGKSKSSSSSSATKPVPAAKAAPAVKKLQNLSGKDYQKAVDKLPKSFSTGGKAPKIDKSKPAGAGSATEEIG